MELTEDDYGVQFETQVGYITNYFDALSALREEGVLVYDGDSVFTKLQDPSNVAMAISKIEGEGLDSINIGNQDLVREGLNFERANDFFSGVNSTNTAIISYPVEEGGAHYMNIDILEEDVEFMCPLIDVSSVPQPPDMEPIVCDTQVSVPGSDFKKAIKHCMKVRTEKNTGAELKTEDNEFIIKSSDQVDGSVRKKFTASGPDSQSTMQKKETVISLDYLDDIKNIIGSSDNVTVHIDDEYPVRIDVDLDDIGDAKIVYVIAPRLPEQA